MVKVAVVSCSPETLFYDVERVVSLADFDKWLSPKRKLVIKLNLSWSKFFPACSTSPYIFDAVVSTLIKKGFTSKKIIATENETVVTDINQGLTDNGWNRILEKHDITFIPLTKVNWVPVSLSNQTLALEELFGEVITPEFVIGADLLHLPTVKTHGHSSMSGALKNAFGLFLKKNRHLAHLKIHEILVDLLALQKEICGSLFAVTDGTVIGDGAGPRTMKPKIGNILLASNDMVAIDTVQCVIMGVDPLNVKMLQLAEERGLGISNPDKIEIVGDYSSIGELPNFQCNVMRSPVIKYDRIFRSSILGSLLFSTPLVALPTLASKLYHDYYWYPIKGKDYVNWFLNETQWGKWCQKYVK